MVSESKAAGGLLEARRRAQCGKIACCIAAFDVGSWKRDEGSRTEGQPPERKHWNNHRSLRSAHQSSTLPTCASVS